MTTTDIGSLLNEDITLLAKQMASPQPVPMSCDLPVESILQGSVPEEVISNPRIMIVDDEPINIKVVQKYLKTEGYVQFITTTQPGEAIELIHKEHPDILLLDVMMPEISGLDILGQIRTDETLKSLPIIILTAANDRDTKTEALKLGATDFLAKPVDLAELVSRVRNTLVVKAHQDYLKRYAWELELEVSSRTQELISSQLDLIHCLAQAAEYRDNDTGRHVIRVGRFAGIIAREMGLEPAIAQLIEHAAPLHDIGKIGVPDAILLKSGKLEPEEFEFIQRHCGFGKKIFEKMPSEEADIVRTHSDTGAKIMSLSSSPLLRTAAKICLTHHEKWDGSGYPLGLAGEHIPIEGRITAAADVFDALSSKRPYKPPFPLEKCFQIMKEGYGTHFDPDVLDAFFTRQEEIVRVQIEFAEVE